MSKSPDMALTIRTKFFNLPCMALPLPSDNSYRTVKNWFLSLAEGNAVAEPREAFRWMLEEGLGYSLSRLLAEEKTFRFSEGDLRYFILALKQIQQGVPLQYITGHAWFAGLRLRVTPEVLIPRPETEELVEWFLGRENLPAGTTILDVGTGSGAIALAIKSQAPQTHVTGLDISDKALHIARYNALKLGVNIHLIKSDLFESSFTLDRWDFVISNPPYIPRHEADMLPSPVRLHEPHTSLFVPDEDPALFYRILFGKARTGQVMYVEFGFHQQELLEPLARSCGAQEFERRRDSQGHWRMARIVF